MFGMYFKLKEEIKELTEQRDENYDKFIRTNDKLINLKADYSRLEEKNQKLEERILILENEIVHNSYSLDDIVDKTLCVCGRGQPRIIFELDGKYSIRGIRYVKGEKVFGGVPGLFLEEFGKHSTTKQDVLNYMRKMGYLIQKKAN